MMLRATDRLRANLIENDTDCDAKEKVALCKKIQRCTLVMCIELCGFNFRIWETSVASGKMMVTLEFTSLVGKRINTSQKPTFTACIKGCIASQLQNTVVEIWQKVRRCM